jgi:hypothetical protein
MSLEVQLSQLRAAASQMLKESAAGDVNGALD